MIVSNCPRCNEAFRVPSGELPEDAYAKCPWCSDTFSLSDVLANLPPILEVLSADGQPIVSAQRAATVRLGSGAHRDDAEFDSSSSTAETVVDDGVLNGFDFGETAATETVVEEGGVVESETANFELEEANDAWQGEPSSAPIAPMRVAPARKKRGKYAGLKTAASVVLGGALAVPIADGLLVLAGQPGMGLWRSILGKTGETSGATTVAAAPPADLSTDFPMQSEKLKGRPLSPDPNSQELAAAADAVDAAREIMEQPSVDEFSVDESGVDESNAFEPVVGETDVNLPESPPDASAGGAAEDSTIAVAETQTKTADDDAAADNKEIQDPLGLPAAISEVAPTSAAEELELPKLPAFPTPESGPAAGESAEMIAQAQRAGKMVAAVSAFNGDQQERTRQLGITYKNIAQACGLATGEGDALRTLASKINESPIRKDIEQAASIWLEDASRESQGIALIGRPGAGDDGQVITLDSGKVVSVAGDVLLPSAKKILVMGTILDDGSSVNVVLAEALP